MIPALTTTASLPPIVRQDIGVQMVARSQPISHLAATHQVSRKFVYQQSDKAQQALNESFAPSQGDDDVLFNLPVTKNWLYQLILGLVLICHSSYRKVVELFRDLLDMPISIGTVHNRLQATATKAAEINKSQDLSGIKVGLQDEIYQADKPVLVGVDKHDVMTLAGPALAVRQELYDFHCFRTQTASRQVVSQHPQAENSAAQSA